jgi:ComF family protein
MAASLLGVRGGSPGLGRPLSVVPSLEHFPAVEPPPSGPAAWRAWVTALLDLVFPPFCVVCRAGLGEGRRDPLCGSCWHGVERLAPPWCRVCGLEFGRFGSRAGPAPTGYRCGQCRRRPPAFTYARSAAHYGEIVREALHAFKFGGRRALAAPLGDLLAEMGRLNLPVRDPDLLVPVPLHPRRERERGFNQALLLARHLGRAWQVPVRGDVLVRTAPTSPQTELRAEARRANVRGAFALRRPELVTGRHVVVVDDILTTGSTAAACASCLREGGAAAVGVLTVARAS